MATEKQIAANRRNATKSTGPRTEEGKARSRMNALSHGLSVLERKMRGDQVAVVEVSAVCHDDIIELESSLRQVREGRVTIFERISSTLETCTSSIEQDINKLKTLNRYERRIRSAGALRLRKPAD